MKTLRRFDLRDRPYFVTVVTYQRQPVLLRNPLFFLASWETPPLAWVLLPDHFHAIVDVKERSISQIIHAFKASFRPRFSRAYGPGRIWQHRFWDHIVRDAQDLQRNVDYIHFNVVHHYLSADPMCWEWSSCGDFLQRGWCHGVDGELFDNGEFGE